MDVLVQCLRRKIPYNLEKHVCLAQFASGIRPFATPKTLEFVVVSSSDET